MENLQVVSIDMNKMYNYNLTLGEGGAGEGSPDKKSTMSYG